ncbi:hypothetical protein NDU88_001921 [Pleurodeles waltl]|uniref:Uncharacterized protein n=1 Tax=Pleurodeles waltl TaxID=8319 RepID=A0AAV7W1E2_PLEWA|nr:hypothetical protein NDU88_001921 [Pleurodeles waltl]
MEVQRLRGSYSKVKQQLSELEIKYALLLPVKMKVIDGEITHMFLSPEDAWTWLHTKGLPRDPPDSPSNEDWLVPKTRLRKGRSIKVRPTKDQVAAEQARTVSGAELHSMNTFTLLGNEHPLDQDRTRWLTFTDSWECPWSKCHPTARG